MMDPLLFELAQESVIGICECSVTADGYELKPASKFMRWPRPLILDLEVSKWEELLQDCGDGHEIEEFFLAADFTNQWLRTVVAHETFPGDSILDIPSITFHSYVVPYDPCWSEFRPITHKKLNALEFPFSLLKEGLQEKKTLKAKLQETLAEEMRESLLETRTPLQNFVSRFSRKEPEIGSMRCENCDIPRFQSTLLRKPASVMSLLRLVGLRLKPVEAAEVNTEQPQSPLFGDIQAADVEFKRHLVPEGLCGPVSLVTWKTGKFIQKQYDEEFEAHFEAELQVLKRLCHPNIVFSFGKLSEGGNSSFFMEYMSQDLKSFIADKMKRPALPFLLRDSVDILLQIAKALRHMHHDSVNVVHCDLKSANILINKIQVSRFVEHYVAKVTDFGSARPGNNGDAGFWPGPGTTPYCAPEVLKSRKYKTMRFDHPHKIDVYSFGVVAFEVITGELLRRWWRKDLREKVMEGTWRPPLRETRENGEGYMRDEKLISLIESCWLFEPSERPTFDRICEVLDGVKDRLSDNRLSVPSQR